MTIKQRTALAAVAKGCTYKEAARAAGYKNLETVWQICNSNEGKAYLRAIAKNIDAETVYSVRERIADLRTLARVHLFTNPKTALACVREANKLAKCG
ncbi:hypothetical protein HW115_01730 [Verrucomicrobiaceae bacterium N1E253]|uniref:Uncharacterized protein n=1 Tax=Oceaniferula marina TaxID=2748318 RepID=A0A851GJE3_9BACT|nr:hypothetical protein [Oceaniferula marina]NWK54314.1 hypothetical protein [Oceaniferula marina]